MYISFSDSRAHGFNRWCEEHDAGRKGQNSAGADDVPISGKDVNSVLMAPSERLHRP